MSFDPSQFPFMEIAFWVMTVLALGGGIGVVASKNLFHSALFLIVSLFGVSGYYVLLSAGFLAVVQLMVYAGAIAVLVLFAIMFSRRPMEKVSQANHQWWLALLMAILLFAVLVGIVGLVDWPKNGGPEPAAAATTVQQLGVAFLGSYLIPFMVVSILLSVALIGAIMLAREKLEAEEMN
jgi:NADH:ubiquinone oxidoreductase subunit 6 (subunit J)